MNPFKSNASAAGKSGEERARDFLKAKGYRFLRSNYGTRMGELDLVMEDGETLVFVEVKTRARSDYGLPQEFVVLEKQRKVVKAALSFVKQYGHRDRPLRFDVVSIGPDGVEHLENAFQAEGGRYTL